MLRASHVFCVLLLLVLGGCSGKTVSLVDEAGFRGMAVRIGPVLKAQQILDSEGACLTPLLFSAAPDDAGERLFRRLSPAFRFRAGEPAQATFAASRAEGDALEMLPYGFALTQGTQRITVSLLGLADWDGNGSEDWFVRCSVKALQREEERDYYLVIQDPEATAYRPLVIGVYDCRSRRCVTYTDASYPPESTTVELLSGQRAVTMPPAKGKLELPHDPNRPQEQKLKN